MRNARFSQLKDMFSLFVFDKPKMVKAVVLNLFELAAHECGKNNLAADPSVKTDQNNEFSTVFKYLLGYFKIWGHT